MFTYAAAAAAMSFRVQVTCMHYGTISRLSTAFDDTL